MMHKYCPTCGSLDLKRLVNGTEECLRCKYRGEFKEGSMDQINAFRKSKRPVITSSPSQDDGAPKTTNVQLKEKLKNLKGTKTDDFEII